MTFPPPARITLKKREKDAAIHSECHRNHGFVTIPYKFVGFRKLPLPRQIHGFRNARSFDETSIILLS